jgi:hypothetical protein
MPFATSEMQADERAHTLSAVGAVTRDAFMSIATDSDAGGTVSMPG